MEFDLEQAIIITNNIVYEHNRKNLTDVEIAILEGAWNREEYESIAVKNNYSTSYLSQDVAPKLWKRLSEILGEKVRKSNFRSALNRHRQHLAAASKGQSAIAFNQDLADLYVERKEIEAVCRQTLSEPGGLLRLKGSRLLGKTSLMNRVLAQMKDMSTTQGGYEVVYLSLKLADKNTHFKDLNRFLRWLCSNLSLELGLPCKLDEYWEEEDLGAKVSCTIYLQDYVLSQLDRPLVWCLDDVDLLFLYPRIYEDFFALLRSWYEKARTRQRWQNLRLAIVHATDVYIRLNMYQSPFNVGFPQVLPEFTPAQTRELALKHRVNIDRAELLLLIDLVGGHPFLLQKAFNLLRSDRHSTIKNLLAEATTESGIYSNHLRELWIDLQQHPELSATFAKLLAADTLVLDPVKAYQLQNIGLIELSGNQAKPRCKLYSRYFKEYLQS